MTAELRIGVLGGTFDPIHLGHLDVADAARSALGLDEVRLVPARVPPHRVAGVRASVYHRFAMVSLAAGGRPGLVASDVELRAPGLSFTSATLRRLHERGLGARQIFFITGADAFAEIATWRDYPDVLNLAHFVVVSRPGLHAGALGGRLPDLASRMIGPAGDLGARAARAPSAAIFLVEAPTADVSSTEVRRRAAAGESLAGLVPPDVDAYIQRHHLYSSTSTADHLHE